MLLIPFIVFAVLSFFGSLHGSYKCPKSTLTATKSNSYSLPRCCKIFKKEINTELWINVTESSDLDKCNKLKFKAPICAYTNKGGPSCYKRRKPCRTQSDCSDFLAFYCLNSVPGYEPEYNCAVAYKCTKEKGVYVTDTNFFPIRRTNDTERGEVACSKYSIAQSSKSEKPAIWSIVKNATKYYPENRNYARGCNEETEKAPYIVLRVVDQKTKKMRDVCIIRDGKCDDTKEKKPCGLRNYGCFTNCTEREGSKTRSAISRCMKSLDVGRLDCTKAV